jgi:hypothetical protein
MGHVSCYAKVEQPHQPLSSHSAHARQGDMDVLRQESASLGMPKSAFAFALDKGSERESGTSLLCKSKEIYTNR